MARLGAVVGTILADLVRARLAADELSRALAEEYRDNPVLASMSVPRLVIEETTLTLRFSVTDLEMPSAPEPDPRELRDAWVERASSRLVPQVIEPLRSEPERHMEVEEAIAESSGAPGTPTLTHVRRAIGGEPEGLVTATVEPLVEAWAELPAGVRTELGGKRTFRGTLERTAADDFDLLLARHQELGLAREALASQAEVEVRPEEMPEQPELIQELRITARGEDIDALLGGGAAIGEATP